MKLGEALTVRRRQADKLNDLRGRVQANALRQEGTEEQESVRALLDEFERLSLDHGLLVQRINRTNLTRLNVNSPDTILSLIAQKDHLSRVRALYQQTAEAATVQVDRRYYGLTKNEVRFEPTVAMGALRESIDGLSEQINTLDLRIQETNWRTDLVE